MNKNFGRFTKNFGFRKIWLQAFFHLLLVYIAFLPQAFHRAVNILFFCEYFRLPHRLLISKRCFKIYFFLQTVHTTFHSSLETGLFMNDVAPEIKTTAYDVRTNVSSPLQQLLHHVQLTWHKKMVATVPSLMTSVSCSVQRYKLRGAPTCDSQSGTYRACDAGYTRRSTVVWQDVLKPSCPPFSRTRLSQVTKKSYKKNVLL